MNAIDIARVAYEINRAYCQALGEDPLPAWEEASNWQQASAVKGVQFHLADPDAGPAASHESWMSEKLAGGWEYGPVKDPERKQHPHLVPFESLPAAQQAKYHLFHAVVRALRGHLGDVPSAEVSELRAKLALRSSALALLAESLR